MSAAAEGRPHPERDDQRALRVRAGDERQDRHQLGVDGQQRHRRAGHPQLGREWIWPAWTDAISSSVDAKSWPPADPDVRLVRLDEDARRGAR